MKLWIKRLLWPPMRFLLSCGPLGEKLAWRFWHFIQPTYTNGVAVLVFDSTNRRLLVIKKKRGFGAGHLQLPGGGIDPESATHDSETDARREVIEETGFRVGELHLVKHFVYPKKKNSVVIYITQEFEWITGNIDSFEIEWAGFIPLLERSRLIPDHLRIVNDVLGLE